MAWAKIRIQMMERRYIKICPVLEEMLSAAASTVGGLIMYKDICLQSFSCLKHEKSTTRKAMIAMMYDKNMNIMLDSASLSNKELMSSISLLSSMLSIKVSLKSLLSLLILSELER